MKYLVTGKEMKLLDQNTSNYFKVPELVLMEQAAMKFVWKLCDILKDIKSKKGIVFCGLGNNGADGIAIARLLNEYGVETSICKVKDLLDGQVETSKSFQTQETIYQTYNYPIIDRMEQVENDAYDFVIDAMFGIGLSRNLCGIYEEVVTKINEMTGVKVAVDMPSGVHSDNGQILGCGVKCDYTITFSFGKVGQFIWPGYEYAGHTIVVDMGITERSWLSKNPSMAVLEKEDLSILPKRPEHSNKGTFGKLLVIAGSVNMAGASVFAAKAAYRSGVGLVKVFTREENRVILQSQVPEALLSTYTEVDEMQLLSDIKWADAIVIGPGLGMDKGARQILKIVRSAASVPVVWDADALNIMSEDVNDLLLPHTEYILTPHLGEFSRMTGKTIPWIQEHMIESAVDFARTYDVTCVLKDFHTIVATPFSLNFLNLTGNNGMATGGSGDALAGIIGALLAQGMKVSEAAAYGVFIHGLAGDYAKKEISTHAMISSDIIDGLKKVWKGTEYAE